MQIKLAQALLRRKELQGKVEVLKRIDVRDLFEEKVARVNVADGIDEVTAHVPKLTASQFTAELDWHSRQLRLIDAAIQQANWTTEIETDDSVMADFSNIETPF